MISDILTADDRRQTAVDHLSILITSLQFAHLDVDPCLIEIVSIELTPL
jgi:hypothetical protein